MADTSSTSASDTPGDPGALFTEMLKAQGEAARTIFGQFLPGIEPPVPDAAKLEEFGNAAGEWQKLWLAFQDQHLVLDRRGRLEESWMDLFYSPVPSDSGQPGGVLAVVVETTRRVLSERRLAALRGIAAKTADAKTVEEAAALSCAACEEHREDIPFALVYLLDASLTRAKLTGRFGVEADSECAPEIVEVGNGESKWPWREAIEAQKQTRFDRSHFLKHGDAALEFETVYYVLTADYNQFMDIQQAINLRIHRKFQELGVDFAIPTQKLVFAQRASAERDADDEARGAPQRRAAN